MSGSTTGILPLTPADLRPLLLEIVAEKPDQVNPRDSSTHIACVYTAEDDPSCHCLIGEMLDRHPDLVCPGPDVFGGVDLLSRWGRLPLPIRTVEWLGSVQREADQCDSAHKMKPWGHPAILSAIKDTTWDWDPETEGH